VRLQSGKPVEQRVYVTQVRGFRGVFRARRERSERLGLGLTVLILIALAAARILRPEGQPVHLELALGLASLVWLLWAGAYVRGYRGMVRRYRVDPKGTIWVPGPDGEHPVRLEEYGRVQARRGSESGTYRQGGVNKGYWQRIELRKPIGEARALTFVCRGTWSETHDVPVMAYVVANYFHSACKRAGLTLSGPPSSGWSARRTEGEGGASTDPWDPEAMGVRVQGTLVMPDGRTVDVDERIDAHNLLDDEILDTVESLVQGAHPGGRWADRSQVKVNRGGPRSSN